MSMKNRISVCLCISVLSCCGQSLSRTPVAAERVCGPVLDSNWYPQRPFELTKSIEAYLAQAGRDFGVVVDPDAIRAVIVPHAGHRYSGLCAATAFAPLLEKEGKKNGRITRVVLIAPSHHVPYEFVALPDCTSYRTCLGSISIDRRSVAALAQSSDFKIFPGAFAREHDVEIQLPFLQQTISHFSLLPLLVGSLDTASIVRIAAALRLIIDRRTLVVISSDFVHHGAPHGYQKFVSNIVDRVRRLDSQVVEAIGEQSTSRFMEVMQRTDATVCGRDAIALLLSLMQKGTFGTLESRLTCYYCSPQIERARASDGTIDVSQLLAEVPDADAAAGVSYVGLLFTTQKRSSLPILDRLTGYEKKALLRLARRSIENAFAPVQKPVELIYSIASEGLSMPAGAFVTLKTKDGDLRGCIGSIETTEPLYKTIHSRALDAAFHDNRFTPLSAAELRDIVVDITVLELPKSIKRWKDIVVGRHGVVLRQGLNSAVFLPQVAPEQGWNLETMLSHLAQKAGLPTDAWRDRKTTFRVFEGGEIREFTPPSPSV